MPQETEIKQLKNGDIRTILSEEQKKKLDLHLNNDSWDMITCDDKKTKLKQNKTIEAYFFAAVLLEDYEIAKALKDYVSAKALNEYLIVFKNEEEEEENQNALRITRIDDGTNLLSFMTCQAKKKATSNGPTLQHYQFVQCLLEMGANPHASNGGNVVISIINHYVSSGLKKINFTENDKAFCKLIINDKWDDFEFPYIDNLFGTRREPGDYERLLPLLLAAGDSPRESNCGDWMRTDYSHSEFKLSRYLLQLGRAINDLEKCGAEENDASNREAILKQAKILRKEIPAMIESKSTANFEAKLNEFHQNELLRKVPNYQAVLANIGLAILGLVVFYLIATGIHAAKTHGRHFFFFTQTNDQKKCEKIENITKNISQQMKK